MRGISKKAIPYVPERDREAPEGEQTTFWVRPRKGDEGAKIVSLYTGAERANPGAYRQISEAKWKAADVTVWLDTVEKIDNFAFSEDFPELQAQGFIEEISDPELLKKVMRDIPLEDYNEVINFAAKISTLTETEKNVSASLPISSRGSARSKIDK